MRADLAILEAEHVNATWFPIGRFAETMPEVWREIARAGFPIGNHTQDHPILTGLDYDQVLAQIETDNRTMRAIIGRPLAPFVRPPGGAWNTTILAAAKAAGERAVVNWDTTDGDTGRPYDDIPLLVSNAEQGRNGSILLMHANMPYAQEALPTIIAYYRARGYEFVTLGQLFGIPGPVPFPSAATPSATARPTAAPSPTRSARPSSS